VKSTGGAGGIIESPHYPRKYSALSVCMWSISARSSKNKILIEIPDLNMEGMFLDSELDLAILLITYF
jgi:hypothetical protein